MIAGLIERSGVMRYLTLFLTIITFAASANAAIYEGAVPVFAEIEGG